MNIFLQLFSFRLYTHLSSLYLFVLFSKPRILVYQLLPLIATCNYFYSLSFLGYTHTCLITCSLCSFGKPRILAIIYHHFFTVDHGMFFIAISCHVLCMCRCRKRYISYNFISYQIISYHVILHHGRAAARRCSMSCAMCVDVPII